MKTLRSLFVSFFIATLALLPDVLYSQASMSVSPDMLVLNAVGNFESIQCQFSGCPSGAISGVNITMTFNGVVVSNAFQVHYGTNCVTFVEFNRAALIANPYVQSLANTGPVTVQIFGSYFAGSTEVLIDRIGTITIVAPKKKN